RRAYCKAEWTGPAQGLLNPVQEVSAAAARVENGFSTREREAAEMNGSDFWQNARQRKQENKVMEEVNGVERTNNAE
ncbi:MAG: phage portal protein, partial [Firmicutes bacterium]|nr:phage portal protein [Bacillota bacterium]